MAKVRWHYQGDVNLYHGGIFMDFSDWKYGYASVVEVTDLDSACGFRGAVMIEKKAVMPDSSNNAAALACCGMTLDAKGNIQDGTQTYEKDTLAYRMALVYALNAYQGGDVEESAILQLDRDEPTQFENWEAERLIRGTLDGYVRRNFLGLSR